MPHAGRKFKREPPPSPVCTWPATATPGLAFQIASAWAAPPRPALWRIRSYNCPTSRRRRSAGVNSCTYKRGLLQGMRQMGYTLLLLFTAQAQPDSPARTASVRGVVTNSASGEGLRKAYLRLASIGEGSAYPVTTND